MTNKILLATFLDKNFLEEFYSKLDKFYSIKKDKVFLFSIGENYMATFKLNSTENLKNEIKSKLRGTIQIHKKGECFYTINALNKLIQRDFDLKEGNIDYKSFKVNWEDYQNKLLLVKDDNLLIQDIKKVIL